MRNSSRVPSGGKLPRSRRGSILVVVAVSLTVLLMFAALAIDFGYLMMERQRAQNAVDAAAHAALVAFATGTGDIAEADLVAHEMLRRHGFPAGEVRVGAYSYDDRDFSTGGSRTNAIEVSIAGEDLLAGELFLASRLNLPLSDRGGDISALAAIQPREIMFVLDQSCSMATGAKVASMTEGTLLALEAVRDTDPNGVDYVSLVGFGDTAVLHTPLTNVRDNFSALTTTWGDGICLCSLDPYVMYYAKQLGKNPATAEAFDLARSSISTDEGALHPLSRGDAHYGTYGNAEVNFRCCEPHCNTTLEAQRPDPSKSTFMSWLTTYQHGNGVLWGLQVAREELETNGLSGSHRILIVLGDGLDFCPSGANASAMPAPCNTGGDLLAATTAYAQSLWEDERVHIYPVYYGTSATALSYYQSLATGDGVVFNPNSPAALEATFAEIVWRSQVVLVPR